MRRFEGATIYITGGSSGIGLEMAKIFASRGANMLLIARNEQKLEEARKQVEQSRRGPTQKIGALSVDVADVADVQQKMQAALSLYGAPEILVNSAGINKYADHFENIDHAMFDEVMRVNLYGTRNMIHALLGAMKQKRGHVVVLSSAAGLFGMFGYTAYGTSKAALLGLCDSLRYELKPLGMKVTVVCPPEVDTPMNLDEAKTLPPEGRAVKNLGGFLTPHYAASVIVKAVARGQYLCIPGASTRFLYLLHRLSNGRLTRFVSDMVIWATRKRKGA
ncbi:MAG TPA: SDR family oxidoreductase [Deltaproteobacteria bacterium]|nr:SDR family oxidoreductase [Deltaproteobacteria bacterium]HQI81971.1 SDR family oxidoreductase [Deltaproteobacteria bacterium]